MIIKIKILSVILFCIFSFSPELIQFKWLCLGESLIYAQENKTTLFTEILHLGKEESESIIDHEIFAEIHDFTFDSLENFIIVDSKFNNIKKFDKNGIFIWEHSETGRGPGEFLTPWLISTWNSFLYVYDLGKRKIIVFNSNAIFQREFLLPYHFLGMCISNNGDIYVSGLIVAYKDLSATQLIDVIHVFDQRGKKKKSFGKEINFKPRDVKNMSSKRIIYHAYAGRIALHLWENKLLASPVFDTRTFVYNLEGDLLFSFKNPYFKYKLLNYKAHKGGGGAFFPRWETISGPAIGLGNNYIIKSYLVYEKEEHPEYFIDIFDMKGDIIKKQIPINGLVMKASEDGLLFSASDHPFPQLWIYRINLDQLKK